MREIRLPHPLALLAAGVLAAAALTWVIPAGAYDRAEDPATGRMVAVPGTYHRVAADPVGPFDVAVAVPRGFEAGADVIICILLVGAAFFLVERVGTMGRLVGALVTGLGERGLLAIPVVTILFAVLGAVLNMQEEIVALVPVLLVLARRIGVDPLTVVAASVGGAAIGSAFGPTNPFQAGIALTLAELPLLSGAGLRLAMLAAGLAVWILWTMRHAAANRTMPERDRPDAAATGLDGRDGLILAAVALPLAIYVYGAASWDWGFQELVGAFLVGSIVVGMVARLGVDGTVTTLLEGAAAMLPAALLVGMARSISLVLADGQIIDTMLHAAAGPLSSVGPVTSAVLMVPVQALIHVPVPSVSGQAALTMPVFVPLADLIGLSRQAVVLAYQTGAGLFELMTPTNGALLAVLLASGVPLQRWLRFAAGGWLAVTAVGIAGVVAAITLGL